MRLTEEDSISETAYRLGGINHLNLEIMNELDKALDKVTIELLEGLGFGEIIGLSKNFDVYRYEQDDEDEENDCIVIIDTKEEEEIFCVLYNKKSKQIIFEGL